MVRPLFALIGVELMSAPSAGSHDKAKCRRDVEGASWDSSGGASASGACLL